MFGMCDDKRPLFDAIRNSAPLMFGASDKERTILDLVGKRLGRLDDYADIVRVGIRSDSCKTRSTDFRIGSRGWRRWIVQPGLTGRSGGQHQNSRYPARHRYMFRHTETTH